MPVLYNMPSTDADTNEDFHNNSSTNFSENDDIFDEETNSEETFISSNEIRVPKVAVPEKIILCIDISLDYDTAGYLMKTSIESCLSPKFVLKKALVLFLKNKISLQEDTQFALVIIKSDSIEWICDFTSDVQKIVSLINDLEFNTIANVQSNDLTSVFHKIHGNIQLPEIDCPVVVPPSKLYRVIILYNSSKNIPNIDLNDESYKNLMASPYFILDILYLHEKQSENNDCQVIFNNLANMCKRTSYIFEVSRSVTKVLNIFAKFLSHPFQRLNLVEFDSR